MDTNRYQLSDLEDFKFTGSVVIWNLPTNIYTRFFLNFQHFWGGFIGLKPERHWRRSKQAEHFDSNNSSLWERNQSHLSLEHDFGTFSIILMDFISENLYQNYCECSSKESIKKCFTSTIFFRSQPDICEIKTSLFCYDWSY